MIKDLKARSSHSGTTTTSAKNRDQSYQELRAHDKLVKTYLDAATSENTRKSYRSAIRQFENWGGRLPTTESQLIDYVVAQAQRINTRTLDLHLTAISQWHRFQGLRDPVKSPVVAKTMQGIRRTHGKPKQKAKALSLEHLLQMLKHLHASDESNKKKRDLALLLVGYFGAFRRSELVAIESEELEFTGDGLLVHLKRSKTDQLGSGSQRALPFGPNTICPVRAMRRWLEVANIDSGPVFRPINRWDQIQNKALHAGAINSILKNIATACEFDFVPDLSSHSLRRGLSTAAAREKLPFEQIKKQGGWKNDATVWEYIDEGQQFSDNVATHLMQVLKDLNT